jgi:ABC-2 type transport system permease protein
MTGTPTKETPLMSTMTSTTVGSDRTGGGLAGTIASEWTKLWSLRSTWWSLAGAAALMALFAFALSFPPENVANIPRSELLFPVQQAPVGALVLVQFAPIALAVLMITGEYATGSIRSTLLWDPRRGRVLLAKVMVLALVVLVAGTTVGALGAVVADLTAGEYAVFILLDVVAASARIGLCLSVVSILAVGIGTAIRSTAGALTTVFLLLLLMPYVLSRTPSELLRTIAQYLPGFAGMEFVGTAEFLGITGLPYGPGGGLVILLAWTVAAGLTGYAVFRLRDA